jgi:hypothetical protein
LTADIIAGDVIVYGSVKGNVRGKSKIEIKKNGSVNGDLTTAQIIIEDGAHFKGSIEIEKSAEKEGDKNVFSRTASAPATPAASAEPGVSNHEGMLTAGRTANSRCLFSCLLIPMLLDLITMCLVRILRSG